MRRLRLGVLARRHKWGLGAFIALALLCGGILLQFSPPLAQAVTTVPSKMNFQGRLTNSSGTVLTDGQYNMTFRFYTVDSGGSAVWTEVRETTNRVQLTNGLFSVQLGDVTPIPASLFASGNLYFEIDLPSPATATCSTASCADYATTSPLTPRNPVATSAYSFNSDTLDGIDSAAFGQLGANNMFTGVNTFKNASDSSSAFSILNSGNGLVFGINTSTNLVRVVAASVTNITTASGTGALQIGADGTDNLALDDNEIMARSNGSAGTLFLQKLGGGLQIQATTTLVKSTASAAFSIQNASGVDVLVADTANQRVGIGLASPTLGRLHVGWQSGDTLPAIYGGSSSGSNDQVGVLGRSGSGAGLQGISGSGFGMQASSTSNIGVLGTSTSSIGVQGRSDTSTSGLFVSTNTSGGNASATLVTRASVNQPGDLFQAQDAGNVSLFQINVNGSVQSKVSTDSATGFVVQDAGGIALLSADSVNDRVYIGNTAADGVGVTLVLDTRNVAGDPAGVNGAMYYNSDAGKFRCYEAGAWKDCIGGSSSGTDQVSTYSYFNDFMRGGSIVDNVMIATQTAATHHVLQVSEAQHPGIVRLTTLAALAGRAGYLSGDSGSASTAVRFGNGNTWTAKSSVRVVNLSDATDTYALRVGFIDSGTTESTDGCFFRYTDTVNSGKWQGVCRSAGVETACDTGVTVATNAWKTLQVGVNSTATSATFVIDGVQVCPGAITTNIPTGTGTSQTGFGILLLNTSGTTARQVDIDYLKILGETLTR